MFAILDKALNAFCNWVLYQLMITHWTCVGKKLALPSFVLLYNARKSLMQVILRPCSHERKRTDPTGFVPFGYDNNPVLSHHVVLAQN